MIKRIFACVLAVLMALPVLLAQEPIVITGTVMSSDNETLPGATVRLLGSKEAVVTDIDGNFTLKVPAGAANKKIQISFIGMHSVEMEVSKISSPVTVRLTDDETQLEEVVVTGYTTLSKERATGSFGTLSVKKIEKKLASQPGNGPARCCRRISHRAKAQRPQPRQHLQYYRS